MLEEYFLLHPLTMYIFIGVFSLIVGSFLNVLIYRLPRMLLSEWRGECCKLLQITAESGEKFNLCFPRSFCTNCKKLIPAWHNIPLVSYLVLRGRCAECKQSISLQYPGVELLTMLLSLFAAWHFGFTLTLVFALLFIWILIGICFIDMEHQLIPDALSLGLLWSIIKHVCN